MLFGSFEVLSSYYHCKAELANYVVKKVTMIKGAIEDLYSSYINPVDIILSK